MKTLRTEKEIEVRFSEVDLMRVVWHGSYVLYFEDAREAFGREFGLEYTSYTDHGYYAPLVELNMQYRHPIIYGMRPKVIITYRPTEAAKVVFDYEIRDTADDKLLATAHSVQVFMDMQYNLVWYTPPFYQEWKERWDQVPEP